MTEKLSPFKFCEAAYSISLKNYKAIVSIINLNKPAVRTLNKARDSIAIYLPRRAKCFIRHSLIVKAITSCALNRRKNEVQGKPVKTITTITE